MANKNKNKGPLIYIGPGFRDSVLNTFGIFADGVPEQYRNTIYAKLFVTPEKLNEARRAVGIKGSAMHQFYLMAVKEHEKEEK